MTGTEKKQIDRSREPIAVIGMSCIFPKAPDVKTFWRNILNGVSAIGDPLPEWEASRYIDSGRISTAKGGYLRELYRFNPRAFGIMPNSLDGGEPDQLLALRVARDALSDAGSRYLEDDFDHQDTGIVLGHSTYFHRGQVNIAQHNICLDQTLEMLRAAMPSMTDGQCAEIRKALQSQLPPFNADVCPSEVPNVMTGRISNRLNFHGPNYLIDAACASSLLAINAAVEELRKGGSRMMLAGGVNASLPAEVLVMFTMLNALSKKGSIRPLDAESDGTLLGEGLGIVVLKRLSDALEDNDRIYAVVHGVGQSSDGRGLGLLAPSEKGETLAVRRAYDSTGIDPQTVGLIEAHGTGIALGDKTEIATLKTVFGERTGEQGSIAVGSVKSMISHCIPAAGAASFIKMCLALHHKILPPTLCETVNPALEIETTPLYVNNTVKPWIGKTENPRRAGINSFGFGGVNAHAILEEAPEAARKPLKCSPWSMEMCVFAADTVDGIRRQLKRLEIFLSHREDYPLSDIAYSLCEEAKEQTGSCRLAIAAKDRDDLLRKIAQAESRLEKNDKPFMNKGDIFFSNSSLPGKTAFLFPGEGSQYMGMLSDLATHFDSVREWFDLWDSVYEAAPGGNRTDIIFPPNTELTTSRRAALDKRLHQMDVGSEAVFIAGQAMNAALNRMGVVPDVMMGHSSGESSALVASGAIPNAPRQIADFVRRLNDISLRLEGEGKIETGALMAVALVSREEIERHIAGTGIVIAMENCPTQTIVYGGKPAVEKLSTLLVDAGAVCEILPFDRGYHTQAFAPMKEGFFRYYEDIGLGIPKVPMYSCASAGLFPSEKEAVRELASRQWAVRVRFIDTVRTMYRDGVRIFIEAGPSGKLTSFVEQILRDNGCLKDCMVAASNLESRPGLDQLLNVLAKLYVNGKGEPGNLFAGRDVEKIDFNALEKKKPAGVMLDNTMPRFHATSELTGLLLSISRPEGAPPLPEYPFITGKKFTGTGFTGAVRLNLDEHRFLQDHVLSGTVSEADPRLKGLSCVPMMVSLEIMAEACALLSGRDDLTVIEEVFAFDWIALGRGEAILEVKASPAAGRNNVYRAEIRHNGKKIMSGDFLFGPQETLCEALPGLKDDNPIRWPEENELYRVGMYHGPIFQSLPQIERWGETGIDARLSSVSLNGFIREGETPRTVLNPVLLDALSQLSAFWVAQKIGTDFNCFPSKIERIELYVPCPRDLDGLTLHARQHSVQAGAGEGSRHWDFECLNSLGHAILRARNMHSVYFAVPHKFYACRFDPLNGWLGNPVEAVDGDVLQWYLPHLPEAFCIQSNGMFQKILAYCLLDAVERTEWQALTVPLAEKAVWLFRRACIKEAVRYRIYQQSGTLLYPSDIRVACDANGTYFVDGWWRGNISESPAVSLEGDRFSSSVTVTDAENIMEGRKNVG
ncbi:MAG: beta-ketoacyl synthase N-terminal-like domain-containing protein [Pseudomonadota bacterium]